MKKTPNHINCDCDVNWTTLQGKIETWSGAKYQNKNMFDSIGCQSSSFPQTSNTGHIKILFLKCKAVFPNFIDYLVFSCQVETFSA